VLIWQTQGFTAIVDKALSKKYEKLVDRAPELIKAMPWGPAYEVVVFRKPDFTALEVLNFATGGKVAACSQSKLLTK
jgi:dipeptidyl-peptidase-3